MAQDVWIPRLVVSFVGMFGLAAIAGATYMATPPTWFASVSVGALTGLIGYLVPSPLQHPVISEK